MTIWCRFEVDVSGRDTQLYPELAATVASDAVCVFRLQCIEKEASL